MMREIAQVCSGSFIYMNDLFDMENHYGRYTWVSPAEANRP